MNIQPLAAYRYNPARVGSLSDVVAPPYDVISPELQDELYAKHPNNVVRLILNKILDCDDESDNRYIRSAKTLKQWKDEGVLQRENAEAIYVYHQIYNVAGKDYVRLMLTTACKMNFSQIFGLYPDSENEIQNILENAIVGQTPIEATDHLGVTHRMWVVTDPAVISQVVAKMGPKPIFIADGHHRYETACNYRKQIRQTGALTADHPANYVLMVCVAMEDPGLIVLPTHRLFRGMAAMTQAELIEKLGNCFRVTTVGDGAIIAEKAWTLIEQLNDQGTMALYTGGDGRWSLIQITDAGRAKMAQIASDHHPEWQALGVAILHRLVIETLLDVRKPEKPKYVHTVKEVVEDLRANPREFPMAALVMPATVGHIQELSMLRERMPPKSTYFYPKLITGFVFNPLE